MKVQIRRSTFETNSSSTHSVNLTSAEKWKKFKAGQLVWDSYEDDLIPIEIAQAIQAEEGDEEEMYGEYSRFKDYNSFMDDGYLESYWEEMKTEKGESVVIFGHYGYDG